MAKEQREYEEKMSAMTPEEIEEMEKSIPEWKRGALVVGEEAPQEEKKGVFGRLKQKVTSSEKASKFYESEEY